MFSLQPKGSGAKSVAIVHHTMCHVAPFLKVTKGAKFEQCHYYIFGDIFDYVIHLLMETLMTSSIC